MHRKLQSLAFAAAAMALLVHSASAQTKWNLPTAYPVDNPHTVNLAAFAKEVADATGGKLQIALHPGASLFKGPDIKRAVATGQAQMGEVLISIHENESPIFGIDVVPFLATSFDDARKLWKASRGAIEQKLAAQGVITLFAVTWPPQGIFAKKEINSIEDMKGLKWRAYNVGTARIGELVGAQTVTIQAAELPQALATGVVNAFMSSGATGYDFEGVGVADPFLRHPGLAAEERDHDEQGGVRRARQAHPGGDPESGGDGRGTRMAKLAGEDPVVSRATRRQGDEGAAAEPGARLRLQEGRRAAHRRLAQEGRRRRPGGGRRLQEDVAPKWRGPGGFFRRAPGGISRPVSRVL